MRITASGHAKNGGKMTQMFKEDAKRVKKKILMDAAEFTLIFIACTPRLHLLLWEKKSALWEKWPYVKVSFCISQC